MSDTSPLIFVYGSLKQGQANHHYLTDGQLIQFTRTTRAAYSLISLGDYPAALPNGHAAIKGELYKVSQTCLQRLDELEENGKLYQRQLVELGAQPQTAWMYLLRADKVATLDLRITGFIDTDQKTVLEWN